MELLHDTYTWLFLSFAIFVGAMWILGRPIILRSLDQKINIIRQEVENAQKLRAEAAELLTSFQTRQRDAMREADEMLAAARDQADHVRQVEEQRLTDMMHRKEQQLTERVNLLRDQTVAELRDLAARLGVEAAEKIVTNKMDDTTRAILVDRALAQVQQRWG